MSLIRVFSRQHRPREEPGSPIDSVNSHFHKLFMVKSDPPAPIISRPTPLAKRRPSPSGCAATIKSPPYRPKREELEAKPRISGAFRAKLGQQRGGSIMDDPAQKAAIYGSCDYCRRRFRLRRWRVRLGALVLNKMGKDYPAYCGCDLDKPHTAAGASPGPPGAQRSKARK